MSERDKAIEAILDALQWDSDVDTDLVAIRSIDALIALGWRAPGAVAELLTRAERAERHADSLSGQLQDVRANLREEEGRVDRLETELKRLREALDKIIDWAGAYPEDVFRPLSDAEEKTGVEALHAAVSNGSDRMHASWARYLLRGHAEVARAALAPEAKPDA